MDAPLTRRSFIKSSGALAAAALPIARVRADPQAATMPGKRTIRKAVKLGMVSGQSSILEKFQLLKTLGYDGVELASPNDLDSDAVLAARDESGLVIHGVVDSAHWRVPLSDPRPDVRAKGREALETALRDAHRYGATTVLLVPAVVNKQVSYADAYARSQAEIRELLPVARQLEVKIAIENVWNHFLLSPLEAARYIDEFESPWIGWYLDVGNIVNYGWPEQWVRTLNRRILKLDIKAYSRAKRDNEGLWKGFDVELGEGDCDWPAVMAALDEIGYSGWATAEMAGGGPERLKDIAERMDRVLSL
ncbi:MAG: sugar phosphate isomerase/epimerase family protein [Planctomycetota bacterium]|jgi:hexulose-6-phosphate isomerase